MTAPLIVTRVRDEAAPWLSALAERGVPVELLPLIDIGPPPDRTALEAARRRAGDCTAVMFVSASAARHFFASGAACVQDAPAHGTPVRLWATGPGTRAALIDCGCDAAQIDAPAADATQFDSEALWQHVAGQVGPGARVLIVRGADAQGQPAGRDWLTRQIEAAGGQVDQVAAYTRCAPAFTAQDLRRMSAAATDGSVWWFSSSEAIAHLQAALSGQDWSHARAIATHPRIAQRACDAGFGRVVTCRVQIDELIASIKSLA